MPHFDCWAPHPEERDQFFIAAAGGGAPYLPREELFEVHQRAAREVEFNVIFCNMMDEG